MSEKNTAQERNKAIDLALSQIEKQFGKGAIMRLGNDEPLPGVEAISTGSISAGYGSGGRWGAAWPGCGDIRPGILR